MNVLRGLGELRERAEVERESDMEHAVEWRRRGYYGWVVVTGGFCTVWVGGWFLFIYLSMPTRARRGRRYGTEKGKWSS